MALALPKQGIELKKTARAPIVATGCSDGALFQWTRVMLSIPEFPEPCPKSRNLHCVIPVEAGIQRILFVLAQWLCEPLKFLNGQPAMPLSGRHHE